MTQTVAVGVPVQAQVDAMDGKWYDKTQRWKKDLSKLTSELDKTIYITPVTDATI